MADVEAGAGPGGGPQDAVAAGDGERHRFLQVKRKAATQHRHGLLLVQEIRRGDDHGIELPVQQRPVITRGENPGAIVGAVAREG